MLKSIAAPLVMVIASWCTVAVAGSCCERCGNDHGARRICRVVCETKKVPHVTYGCQCEEICIPERSRRCGNKCVCGSDGCPECKPNFVPTSARVRTRLKLYKRVEEREEKTYKWVVEHVCDACR